MLAALRDVPAGTARSACFVCVLALVRHADDPLPIICQATWDGEIALSLSGDAAHSLDDEVLEHLRLNIPSARSLPLLRALAQGQNGRIVLDYFDHLRIAVEITSC